MRASAVPMNNGDVRRIYFVDANDTNTLLFKEPR